MKCKQNIDSDTATLSNSDIIMEDYYIFIYGVDAWNQIATAAGLPTIQTLSTCIKDNYFSEIGGHHSGRCYGGWAYFYSDHNWHFDPIGWIYCSPGQRGLCFGKNHINQSSAAIINGKWQW